MIDDIRAHEAPREESTTERLNIAAEQLRLASTALGALARLVDEDDDSLAPHVLRLEHRAAELMRTAARLADDLGLAERWGLDILFHPAEERPLTRPQRPVVARPDESIELESIELLSPLVVALTDNARPARSGAAPWEPRVMVPTPPVATLESADDSSC